MKVSVLWRPKPGQLFSGDVVKRFSRFSRQKLFLLCDGMGSGFRVRRNTKRYAKILVCFLKNGLPPILALERLSDIIREEKSDFFLTADLAIFEDEHLILYKCGSAKSVFFSGKQTQIVAADTLPLGASFFEQPKIFTHCFHPGDKLFLLTDGLWEEVSEEEMVLWCQKGLSRPGPGADDATALCLFA